MLRFFVLVLLLLNGAYFAWSQGLLQAYGYAPAPQTEPQRLQQQIKPEALHLLSAPAPLQQGDDATPQVSQKPPACWQAGLFDEVQSTVLRRALASADLPAGTWVLDPVVIPARWIVYMGKYPSTEALARKRAELASLKLKFEPLTNPALQLGLSLGRFETQAGANAALAALGRRGVRTAQVVLEHAEGHSTVLRLPAADDALRGQLEALTPVLAGKSWSPCP